MTHVLVLAVLAAAAVGLLPVGRPSELRAAGPGIERLATATVANTVATNVVTVPRPSGTSAGDVLVACLAANGSSVATGGAPAGWTSIAVASTISNPKVFGYYRVAGLNEPASYSWLLAASVTNGAGIARYAGVHQAAPLDGSPSSASGLTGTPATVPSVTAASSGSMLVGCLAINSSSTTLTVGSPPGMTEAWDVGGKRHEFADQALTSSGPTGDRTWTLSSGRDWVGWMAPLRPAPSAPPSPTATAGPTPTPSASPAPTASAGPTPTASASPTPGPTATPDGSPSYFVDPSGDDLGPGSSSQPWQTLQHALNVAPTGATINLAAGSYAGGSWTRPGLTVVGQPGAVLITPTQIVGVSGAALRGVRVETGTDVAGIIGVDVRSSSGVVLDDLTVIDNSWGIRLQDVTDSTLRDSELTGNALGLEVQSTASGVVISGNQIHDNDRFWATDRSGTGIALANAIGPITISGNGIHRNRLPSASPEDGVGIELFASSGVTISDNVFSDNVDAVETGTDATQTPCGLQMTGNVVYKSSPAAGTSRGVILRCASASLVAHNTFDGLDDFAIDVVDGTQGVEFGGSIAGLVVRDNVIVYGRALSIDSVLPPSVVIDGDVFYNPSSSAAHGDRLAFVATLGNTSSLSELRTWTGEEANGLWADPYFVDRASRDYHLRRGSAASGKGAFPVPGTLPGPAVPRLEHLVVLVYENHAYHQVIGSPDAPYWSFLASQGASMTDMRALTHPSLPNYLGLMGGDTFGLIANCAPTDPGCSFDVPTLVDRMEDAGLSWRGYFDAMPGPCRITSSGLYRINHNPFIYYDDIRLDAARCDAHVRPIGDLAIDLASDATTPTLSFIVPDNCHNMHDCPVATGDQWLRDVLPPIFDSPAWTNGKAALVLTFDEDDGLSGNRIPTVWYGPDVAPQRSVTTNADLYDLLRTFEDGWSLAPLTTNDANASAIAQAFRSTPAADTTAPTRPTDLAANDAVAGRVDLSWTASSDAVGVTAYEVYRDGSWLGWTTTTAYSDTTVTPGLSYAYRVRARDADGNVSSASAQVIATTPTLTTPSPSTGPTASPSPAPTTSPSPSPTQAISGIVRASVSTVENGSATSTITVGRPAGTSAGDVLVACLALNGGGVASSGAPIGWSTIATVVGISNPKVIGYYRVAGPSEPVSYTWTLSSSVKNGAGIARYTGVSQTPIDGSPTMASAGSGSVATVPGVTTSAPGGMLVGCLGINSSSAGNRITAPPGMVEAWDILGKRQELDDQPLAQAEPTGSRSWALSVSRAWAGWLVALRD